MKVILIYSKLERPNLEQELSKLIKMAITSKEFIDEFGDAILSIDRNRASELIIETIADVPRYPIFWLSDDTIAASDIRETLALRFSVIGITQTDPEDVLHQMRCAHESPILAIQDYIVSAAQNSNQKFWKDNIEQLKTIEFRLVDKLQQSTHPGFLFQALVTERVIECSVRGFEYLWCSSYCYVTLFMHRLDKRSDVELQTAINLLTWAEANILSDRPLTWPYYLPRPDRSAHFLELEYMLCCAAWILHHEIGHIMKNHDRSRTDNRKVKEEADEAATKALLDGHVSEALIKNRMGIAIATLILTSLELQKGYFENRNYPPSFQRLYKPLKPYTENEDPVIGFACLIIDFLYKRYGYSLPDINPDDNFQVVLSKFMIDLNNINRQFI